jgi:hypothetical protein
MATIVRYLEPARLPRLYGDQQLLTSTSDWHDGTVLSCCTFAVGHLLSHRKLAHEFVRLGGVSAFLATCAPDKLNRANSVRRFLSFPRRVCALELWRHVEDCSLCCLPQQAAAMTLYGLGSSSVTMETIVQRSSQCKETLRIACALYRQKDPVILGDISHFLSLTLAFRPVLSAFSEFGGVDALCVRALPSKIIQWQDPLPSYNGPQSPESISAAHYDWAHDEVPELVECISECCIALLALRQYMRYSALLRFVN